MNMFSPRKKFKMCVFFQKGACTKGDQCTFAHAESELSVPKNKPPPQQTQPKNDSDDIVLDDITGNSRKRPGEQQLLCRFFAEGKCTKGDECTYSHDPNAEKKPRQSNYKSTLCSNYMAGGNCRMGPNCSFAHGRYELRPFGFSGDFEAKVAESPSWKTIFCKFFAQTGACRNNADCPYAHGNKELRLYHQTCKPDAMNDCFMFKKEQTCSNVNCPFLHGGQLAVPGGMIPERENFTQDISAPSGYGFQSQMSSGYGNMPSVPQRSMLGPPGRNAVSAVPVGNSQQRNSDSGNWMSNILKDVPLPQRPGIVYDRETLYKEFAAFVEAKAEAAMSGEQTPGVVFLPLSGKGTGNIGPSASSVMQQNFVYGGKQESREMSSRDITSSVLEYASQNESDGLVPRYESWTTSGSQGNRDGNGLTGPGMYRDF